MSFENWAPVPMSRGMDNTLLWGGYLCVSAAVIYHKEFASLARRAWLRLNLEAPAIPLDPVDGAFACLTGARPTESERAMALLASRPSAAVTARLMELIESGDPHVARRAAQVLFERQDPASLAAVFRYFVQNAK